MLISCNTLTGQQHSVMRDLEAIIPQDEDDEFELYEMYETVKNKIDNEPDIILPQLLSKAKNPLIPESKLAIYIWAIGLTKSPTAVDDIIKLSSDKESKLIVVNSYKALASIGGEKAGKHLLKQLDKTSEQMTRFNIIDLLAQMQYEPALPKTIEILRQDPKELYWQNVLVFGKYGDIAIPFLLKKIGDKEQNIRTNAIVALGNWLIPAESLDELKNQFWNERSPEVRILIVEALENINTSPSDVYSFSHEVIKKETDENVKKFIQETIDNVDKVIKNIASFKEKKKIDQAVFNSEYNKILKSNGTEGDYDKLFISSSKSDEQKLKKLRRSILQRNSDECFYDYQHINNIIKLNRIIYCTNGVGPS